MLYLDLFNHIMQTSLFGLWTLTLMWHLNVSPFFVCELVYGDGSVDIFLYIFMKYSIVFFYSGVV